MKPRGPLGQIKAFKRLVNRYTGRRFLTKPLRPIKRMFPSPMGVILRALSL